MRVCIFVFFFLGKVFGSNNLRPGECPDGLRNAFLDSGSQQFLISVNTFFDHNPPFFYSGVDSLGCHYCNYKIKPKKAWFVKEERLFDPSIK